MPAELEIRADDEVIRAALLRSHHDSLVAPLDDMWAAFAAAARAHGLLADGVPVGYCAIDESGELLSFFVSAEWEHLAEALFDAVVARFEPVAAVAATVDPLFLSLSLGAGRSATARALMFRHVVPPEGPPLEGLRFATAADHANAVAFAEAALGAPRSFLETYLAARIENSELLLCEEGGEIVASGECRRDSRWPSYAHLGIVVASWRRGAGIGTRLLHSLVVESRRTNREPLCSTEPDNFAARRAIHRAGFRARHRVFRIPLGGGASGRDAEPADAASSGG